jgi:hypothetical protein
VGVTPLFSKDVEPELGDIPSLSTGPGLGLSALSFREERFVPSSSLMLTLKGMRRAIVSGLVAMLLVGAVLVWVGHSFRKFTLQSDQQAQEAFAAERYDQAAGIWTTVFHRSKMIFDKGGQVSALQGIARCEIRQERFSEALATLLRAEKIDGRPELREQIASCRRLSATQHLKRSQDLFLPSQMGLALLEAKAAVVDFENGLASPGQIAGAHRMVARCALKLADLNQAQDQLDLAISLEGKTAANLGLKKELGQAVAALQKQRAAAVRQASQSKLTASKVKKRPPAAASNSTPQPPDYGHLSGYQSGYPGSFQHSTTVYPQTSASYPDQPHDLPTRRVVDARLPTAPAYPTYQGPTYAGGARAGAVDGVPADQSSKESFTIRGVPSLRFPSYR